MAIGRRVGLTCWWVLALLAFSGASGLTHAQQTERELVLELNSSKEGGVSTFYSLRARPSGSLNMAEKRVKLKSSDDEIFEVDEAVAFASQAVKNMIEDTGIDAPIPLPNVSSKILAKVIEYCEYHVENQKTSEDKPATPEDEINAWDAEFVKVDQATLFNLILAANDLKIQNLLDLTCQTVADMMKGKTPDEIRKMFNMKNDFFTADNAEEEEEVRREKPIDL